MCARAIYDRTITCDQRPTDTKEHNNKRRKMEREKKNSAKEHLLLSLYICIPTLLLRDDFCYFIKVVPWKLLSLVA